MAQVSATVHNSPSVNTGLASSLSKANNIDWNFTAQSYLLNRKPEYKIFLYNVSEQAFTVTRPPTLKELRIPGRPSGAKYALVTSFPQPLLVPKGNVDSNELDITAMDTRRFLTDILNPDNTTMDQDALMSGPSSSGGTNDLGAKGVFWSLNGPGASETGSLEEPTEQEVKKAVARMEKRYKEILDKVRAVEISDPKSLHEVLSPEHHFAADYFGLAFSWHSKETRTDYCPQCGERMRVGAAFHKTEDGGMCILDWKRAVQAGVRTRAQAYEATEDEQFAPKQPKASKE